MTPQIKQRIDQIRRGEVPEGYKKMKSDIIPEEWTSYLLSDIYTERKESGIPSLPILTVSIHSGVSDGALDDDELGKKVKRIEDKTQYRTAHSGDLVFNMMRAWQGAIGVVRSDGLVSPAYIVATPDKSAIYPPFMDYYMKTPQMVNRIHRKSYGVTDFRLRLYWDSFAMIGCAIPPLPEQKKIAEILSAQDKLIALKEKLIEEKKRRKKYLMQQLLTGKKRLPGFSGEWKRFSFSESFTFMTTNTLSRDCMTVEHTRVKNIHYGDILTKYAEVLDCEKVQLPYIKNDMIPQTTEFLQNGDIVIADTAEDLAVGKAIELQNVNEMKILSGLHTLFCRPVKDIFCPGWLGYYLNSDAYRTQLIPLICGVKVSSISKKSILNTIISTPTIEEQKAIVTIFSNANRELDLLNRDLDQEKQKKKALMQLLLSGVVRVNV